MKRSNRTMQAHIPTPKLRIKAKKLYDNNVEETFTSDNILEYSKIEDVSPPSGELAASYVSLNEQQILNHENTDPYISRPLLDNVEEMIMNLMFLNIEEGLDNSVLEEGSFDFEGFSGEYGPYFPNFTSSMIFIWITKHMISTSAYEDLTKILTHPKFRKEDIITNIRQIRKWRNRLPLAKVNEHSVPLSKYRTPSTYESTKKAFTISPLIHLERILNNPILMPKMYFGPGVVTDEMQEFWHGELWQDSLMFGEHKIKKDNEVYKAGDFLICYEQSSTFICRVRDNRHTRGNGNELWLVEGSIGCVTADLPQGNDIADVKRHNAKYGCRSCNVPNDQYTNIDYNYIKNARFHQQTEKQFIEIKSQHSKIDRERLATKYGSISLYGWKARTLLEVTFNIFNTNGENAFIEYWKILKNLHIEVLNNWNMEQNIKQNSAVLKLCTCWAIEAKVLKLAFSNTMTESVYQELQELLKREYEILIQLFSDNFTNLPNLHVNVHLLQHARNFATLLNTAVGVKEMVHRIFKNMVPHMNWQNPILRTIFSGWYATESLSITINNQKNVEDERDDSITVCHDGNFIDISFSNKWNNKKVRSMGLSKKLDADHPFFRDLYEAYTGFLDSKATLLNKNLEFYGSITYTVIKSNQDNIQIKLRVGDVVELCEELKATNTFDPVLECPLYNIQKA
ncbi:unnamed protein product [Rhizophagus irregularis]|nr:unnamed protein product [Rhizophagus irregularis]